MFLLIFLLVLRVCTFGDARFPSWAGCSELLLFPNEWNLALICGQSLPESSLRQSVYHLGLVHLFVVSGFHVRYLSKALKRLKCSDGFTALGIFGFAIVTGGHPPVARATAQYFLPKQLGYWPSEYRVLASALIVLIYQPTWIFSVSFLLSWYASLWIGVFTQFRNSWNLHLAISLIMLPALAPIALVDLVSIPLAFTALFFLSTAAIPIAIISAWIPYVSLALQPFESLLYLFTQLTSSPLQSPLSIVWNQWMWALITVSHVAIGGFRRCLSS